MIRGPGRKTDARKEGARNGGAQVRGHSVNPSLSGSRGESRRTIRGWTSESAARQGVETNIFDFQFSHFGSVMVSNGGGWLSGCVTNKFARMGVTKQASVVLGHTNYQLMFQFVDLLPLRSLIRL